MRQKLPSVVVVGLVVANCVGLVLFLWLRGATGLYREGRVFAVPSGYRLDMSYVGRGQAPCYVLRLTATGARTAGLTKRS